MFTFSLGVSAEVTEQPAVRASRQSAVSLPEVALVLVGSALLLASITRQSLWTDEASVAWLASHQSFRTMFETLFAFRGSESQMPFYVVYMRAWVQLFGVGEYVLRLSNLPFALVLLASMGWISTTVLQRRWAWSVFSISPFLYFYMNEARPYIPLMAICSVASSAVLAYCADPERYSRAAPWIAAVSMVAAFGFHMLAVFLLPALGLFLLLTGSGQWQRRLRDWGWPLLLLSPAAAVLGAYYGWTLLHNVGMRRATGLKNILFVFYEFLGFAGLGPPRNDLRASGGTGVLAYWPWLILGLIAIAAFTPAVFKKQKPPLARAFFISMAAGLGLAVLACRFAHFQFLPRHFAAFYPGLFILFLMVTGANPKPRNAATVGFVALALAWATADARLLLLPAYYKDDYRAAVHIAAEEAQRLGGAIVWAADSRTAYYYGLKVNAVVDQEEAIERELQTDRVGWPSHTEGALSRNWTPEQVRAYIRAQSKPIVLVLSKPDLYDVNNAWSTLLLGMQSKAVRVASLNAFTLYELSPPRGTDHAHPGAE